MTDDNGTFIERAIRAVRDHDRSRPRSQQAEIGWSEIGGCRAYTGFKLDGAYGDETDKSAAHRGTAMDEYFGPIFAAAMGARYQDVEVFYRGVRGHIDLLHSAEDWVADMKAPELGNAKAWAADPSALWQKRVQVHGYAAGAIEAGLLTEACTVRLLVMPCGGKFGDWWVWEEPFDRGLADAGADRLTGVQERLEAGVPLQKDKPYQWCKDWCQFFALCRTPDEASEIAEITDPEIAAAVVRYGELLEITGPAEKEKKALAPLIRGYHAQARGWVVNTGAPGEDKPVLDEEEVRAKYAELGLDVPEVIKPGSSPRLTVTRVKDKEPVK